MFLKDLIPTGFLGQLWEPGHLVGMVHGKAKDKIQSENLPVYTVGSHDTASAVAGVPASSDGDFAFLSSGTWSLMGVENDRALCDSQSLDFGFTNEFGVDGSIRYLKNISGLWIVQECRREWQAMGEDFNYDQLTIWLKYLISSIDVDDPVFQAGDMPRKMNNIGKASGHHPNSKNETIRTALEGLAPVP